MPSTTFNKITDGDSADMISGDAYSDTMLIPDDIGLSLDKDKLIADYSTGLYFFVPAGKEMVLTPDEMMPIICDESGCQEITNDSIYVPAYDWYDNGVVGGYYEKYYNNTL